MKVVAILKGENREGGRWGWGGRGGGPNVGK